ncbi:MAG TPA: FAD:protein FMN transferase [Gemmatimonadaceae bacterium]|nr:FAD:protein FMN transferase [Gemmatimonadaceae bacterium]
MRLAGGGALLLASIFFLPAHSTPAPLVRVSRAWPVMGTIFRSTVWTRDSAAAVALLHAARDSVRLVDSLMSTYRPDSEISRINAHAGEAGGVRVSPHTMAVLLKARLYWRLSGGAFDPTVGPMVNAWGFDRPGPRRPTQRSLDSLRALVGYERVELDSAALTVRLPHRGMRLDLGGIAKGYSLDLARRALTSSSVNGGTVDLGGNVLVFGRAPAGKKWRVSIVDPRRPQRSIGQVLIDSGAVATSGDYERFVTINGKRYGHIIDPRTGAPALGVLSATAIGPLGEWSDGLSATLFLLGPVRGKALVDSIPRLAGIWVVDRGRSVTAADIYCSTRATKIFSMSRSLGRTQHRCGDMRRPLALRSFRQRQRTADGD